MNVTHENFLTEWHGFRDIMCSTEFTAQQKLDAYTELLRVYVLCNDGDGDAETREAAMDTLQVEFPLRMGLEHVSEFEKLWEERNG